jgi:putative ABC transport system ATP-binding protein
MLDHMKSLAVVNDTKDRAERVTRTFSNTPRVGAQSVIARFKKSVTEKPRRQRRSAKRGGEMGTVIEVRDAKKRYQLGKANHVHALRGVSLDIRKGEMVAIMGPSGSGKSTIMHVLGCLDSPDTGTMVLNGRRVEKLRDRELTKIRSKEIGFIFQGFNLIPTLSAIDNVALAAEYAGASRGDAVAKAKELLELVGLADRSGHMPSELSGGQQQRVAIARSLVNSPAIVLGDEPTGDLDTATSDEIMGVMREINVKTGTTFVLVTHNPEVAEACDRTILMRDGLVEDDGLSTEVELELDFEPRRCCPAPALASA